VTMDIDERIKERANEITDSVNRLAVRLAEPSGFRFITARCLREAAEFIVPKNWKWDVAECVDGSATFHLGVVDLGVPPELAAML
jgi:hypothetical protein